MSQRSGARLDTSQEIAVAFLCDLFPKSRNKLLVLDIGMGSGRLAEEMLNNGFYLIDVVELPNQAVTDAQRRNIYDKMYKCSRSSNRLPVPGGMYDIVLSLEGFCGRGMAREALCELVRICKPGGVSVIAVEEKHLYTQGEYTGRLQSAMMDLQTDGFWDLLVREIVPDFSHGADKTTILYVFKICCRH